MSTDTPDTPGTEIPQATAIEARAMAPALTFMQQWRSAPDYEIIQPKFLC